MGNSISLGPQGSHYLPILVFLHQIGTLTCFELRYVEPLCIEGEIWGAATWVQAVMHMGT